MQFLLGCLLSTSPSVMDAPQAVEHPPVVASSLELPPPMPEPGLPAEADVALPPVESVPAAEEDAPGRKRAAERAHPHGGKASSPAPTAEELQKGVGQAHWMGAATMTAALAALDAAALIGVPVGMMLVLAGGLAGATFVTVASTPLIFLQEFYAMVLYGTWLLCGIVMTSLWALVVGTLPVVLLLAPWAASMASWQTLLRLARRRVPALPFLLLTATPGMLGAAVGVVGQWIAWSIGTSLFTSGMGRVLTNRSDDTTGLMCLGGTGLCLLGAVLPVPPALFGHAIQLGLATPLATGLGRDLAPEEKPDMDFASVPPPTRAAAKDGVEEESLDR